MDPSNDVLVCLLAMAVRRERKERDLTQEEFARLVKIDRGYMGGIERADHDLTFLMLMKILVNASVRLSAFFQDIRIEYFSVDGACISSVSRANLQISATADCCEILGAAVRFERLDRGFTQEEFAFLTGLGRSYLSDIENGKRSPSFTVIMRILQGLVREPSEFFKYFEREIQKT